MYSGVNGGNNTGLRRDGGVMGREGPPLRNLLAGFLVHVGVCLDSPSNQTLEWSVELLQKETYSAVGRPLVATDDR